MEKDKRKNNDLQNTTQKFKDRMRSDGMEKLDFKSGGRTIAVTWTIEISKKKKKKKKLNCGAVNILEGCQTYYCFLKVHSNRTFMEPEEI